MKKFLVIFILFGIAYCLAKVTWSYNIYQEQCEAFVQVNEDSSVIFLETMHIPGTYMMTACWDSYITACHVKQDEVSYINGMKKNSTTTFLNNENQICYFQDFGLRVGNMGGFYYQPWSYVSSLNIWVSCEDSSSVPQYCAKTEKMANQVLLAREEMECKEKGGEFEGGVYRFKMPNDSIEYCVAGRCDICNSQWYKNFVEHWKDSVCCESRRKEPNTNNGTCVSPPPFDSTKIGVNHSKITAFPGCSNAKAGKNNNFCFRSSSSSVSSSSTASSSSVIFSSSWSSSSSTASSSSNGFSSSWNSSSSTVSSSSVSSSSNESSSSEYSSSSEDSSSSSEEQEPGSCYPNSSDAQQALRNAEAECWSMQKESSFKLDDNGCLTGECYGGIYSSDDGGESSSSEAESSSSEEERCIDVSLKKKNSDDEEDPWTYVGKEKYTSKTVTYEEPVASSGIFDALGRMYTMVKSKIKYYMGLDSKVTKTVEIGEDLEVWKRNFIDYRGNKAVAYIKQNDERNIVVDSSVYFDKSYNILEINNKENYVRLRMSNGSEYYNIYDEFDNIKRIYSVSVNGDTLDEPLNNYETQTDAIGIRKIGTNKFTCEIDSEEKKKNSSNKTIVKLKDNQKICPEFKKASLTAVCEHPNKPTENLYEEKKQLFYPGVGSDATFGALVLPEYPEPPKTFYRCECIDKETYVFDFRVEYDAYVLIYASNWKYNIEEKNWERKCWRTEDKQKSYDHEMQHYNNLLIQYPKILNEYFITKDNYQKNAAMRTMSSCLSAAKTSCDLTRRAYMMFQSVEAQHNGGKDNFKKYPTSPEPTSKDNRKGREITCTE